MKIRELFEDSESDDLKLSLSSVVNQIKSTYKDTGAKKGMSLKSLIDLLAERGHNFTEDQFREMVKSSPLKNSIASISGDTVTFLGQDRESSDAFKPDQSTKTLEKMAKRAEKKRK